MKKDIEIQENIQEIEKKIESFKKDFDALEKEIQKHKETKMFTDDEKEIAEQKIENERLALDKKKEEIDLLIQTTEELNSLQNKINKKEVEEQLKTLKASLDTIVIEHSWRGKTKLKAETLWQSLPTRGKRGLGLGGGRLAWKSLKALSQSSWMPWNRFRKQDLPKKSEEELKTEKEELKETDGETKINEEKKNQETTTPKKDEQESVVDKVTTKVEEKVESLRERILKKVGL